MKESHPCVCGGGVVPQECPPLTRGDLLPCYPWNQLTSEVSSLNPPPVLESTRSPQWGAPHISDKASQVWGREWEPCSSPRTKIREQQYEALPDSPGTGGAAGKGGGSRPRPCWPGLSFPSPSLLFPGLPAAGQLAHIPLSSGRITYISIRQKKRSQMQPKKRRGGAAPQHSLC